MVQELSRHLGRRLFPRLLGAVLLMLLAAAPSQAVKRRAFVTSVSGNGNLFTWAGATGLTGIERADSVCRARATAGGLPNASTYRAWLSTPAVDAYCHVQGLSGKKSDGCGGAVLPGGGPWYLANGISNFTGTLDELTGAQGVIYRPVMLDELQNELPTGYEAREYWTGTFRTGNGLGDTCGGWTSGSSSQSGETGDGLASSILWTYRNSPTCDQARRLLCLEPGPSETSTLSWSPGAIVFVTSAIGTGELASWPQASGASSINAGYKICQGLAAAAGLPSPASFVPWLSTNLVDARDRITTDGPFRRLDGYTVAASLLDLTDGVNSNSLNVLEDGSYHTGNEDLVWTGTHGSGIADLTGLCANWTVGDNSVSGLSGGAAWARSTDWTAKSKYVCARQQHLYCIANVVTLFWDGFESGSTARW
ncbi:MAG: hypothetical protein IPJ17_16185 [Holophagales bacterium]|nr:MAG: hypothetical protein IPJ17_16185 [Holophagales bacterium]